MKLKTRKAALKRVNPKKRGLARKSAYRGHLLRRKNSLKIIPSEEKMSKHQFF